MIKEIFFDYFSGLIGLLHWQRAGHQPIALVVEYRLYLHWSCLVLFNSVR